MATSGAPWLDAMASSVRRHRAPHRDEAGDSIEEDRGAASCLDAPRAADTTTPKAVTTPAGPPIPAPVTTPELKPKPASTGALAAQTAGKPDASSSTRKPTTTTVASGAQRHLPNDVEARRAANEEKLLSARRRTSAWCRTPICVPRDRREKRPRSSCCMWRAPTKRPPRPARGQQSAAAAPHRRVVRGTVRDRGVAVGAMGRVVKRIDGTTAPNPQPGRMHLADRVDITAPAGVKLSVGDRLMAVRPAGLVSEHVSVVLPTGILEVTNVGTGPLVRVWVRSLSGPLEEGQALLPIGASPAPGVWCRRLPRPTSRPR